MSDGQAMSTMQSGLIGNNQYKIAGIGRYALDEIT